MTSVLIVDDNEDLRELVTLKLRYCGFDVRTAANGADALQSVAELTPDIVLLDVMMPGMSGLEVLEHWRADVATASLPVVLLTAKAQVAEVVQGFELGADDYIVKPFRNRDLVDRVNEILDRSHG